MSCKHLNLIVRKRHGLEFQILFLIPDPLKLVISFDITQYALCSQTVNLTNTRHSFDTHTHLNPHIHLEHKTNLVLRQWENKIPPKRFKESISHLKMKNEAAGRTYSGNVNWKRIELEK